MAGLVDKAFMRSLLVLLFAIGCSTKPNPNRCCVDEADCAAANLPVGMSCEAGLICRGNQCIAEICAMSSECEASAPYCVNEMGGRCVEACTDTSQCPGFGQSVDEQFCEGGACVACRAGMNDCAAATPICDAGICRTCASHTDCPAGFCATDGSCVDAADIAFVDPNGSAASDCSMVSPCTLARALVLTPDRVYVELAAGTYSSAATVAVTGEKWFLGVGVTRPILTNSAPGPILRIGGAANVTIENLEISGATGANNPQGNGIECPTPVGGTTMVNVVRSLLAHNAGNGLRAQNCSVTATQTTFTDNSVFGVSTTDTIGTFDRCMASANLVGGMDLDGGLYTLTNSFVVRNGSGIGIFSSQPGSVIQFTTIVDNAPTAPTAALNCRSGSSQTAFPNNIIARNGLNTFGTSCSLPGSIVSTDVTALHFKSPDVAPFDYHITAGSSAIDQATISTVDHDFDGDPRPQGAGRDVGADEAQ